MASSVPHLNVKTCLLKRSDSMSWSTWVLFLNRLYNWCEWTIGGSRKLRLNCAHKNSNASSVFVNSTWLSANIRVNWAAVVSSLLVSVCLLIFDLFFEPFVFEHSSSLSISAHFLFVCILSFKDDSTHQIRLLFTNSNDSVIQIKNPIMGLIIFIISKILINSHRRIAFYS